MPEVAIKRGYMKMKYSIILICFIGIIVLFFPTIGRSAVCQVNCTSDGCNGNCQAGCTAAQDPDCGSAGCAALGDNASPVFYAFSAAVLPGSVTLNWSVQDTGGSHLSRIEFWRAPDVGNAPGAWAEVASLRQDVSVLNIDSKIESVADNPPAGAYWYGVHAVDKNNNLGTEPSPPGQLKIIISAVLTASISSPQTEDIFTQAENINFNAAVQGGNAPYNYTWRSDKDGDIGRQPSLNLNNLTVNDHQISLLVTDDRNINVTAGPIIIHVIPASFDWSHKVLPNALPSAGNWMTTVKNQGAVCGSCYAFAAAAVVEAKYKIINNNSNLDLNLSEQHLVDCSSPIHCGGGGGLQSLQYIKDFGVSEESCLAYSASNANCPTLCDNGAPFPKLWRADSVQSFYRAAPADIFRKQMKNALIKKGPLEKAMMISGWNPLDYHCSYLGGDHEIAIVGYDDSEQVWIAKNSWGPTWNGNGYFKIAYGQCAIDNAYNYIEQVY